MGKTAIVIVGVLVLIVLCANLTGDGLRDALDPSARPLRRRRR